jgi:hypothetical protein
MYIGIRNEVKSKFVDNEERRTKWKYEKQYLPKHDSCIRLYIISKGIFI